MKQSQEDKILEYLQSGKSITPMDALQMFGCFRLGARIFNLKKKGYPIQEVDTHQNGKTFASYYLMSEQEETLVRQNHYQETLINQRAGKQVQLAFMV